MKSNYTLITIALLLSAAVTTQAQKKTLSVGDKAPLLNGFRWLKGDSLSSWSNELHLIEFGATWCKPCIAAIPELTAIQKENKERVRVISVFVQEKETKEGKYIATVNNFLKKRGSFMEYSVATDWPNERLQHTWLDAAKLIGIPHAFIVDRSGEIKWIGATTEARAAINSLLNNQPLAQEEDDNYDPGKLLLIDGNGGDPSDFLFRSMLTRYDGKINGLSFDHVFSFHVFKPDTLYPEFKDKLELIGYPVSRLYYLAYSDTLTNSVRWRHNNEYPDTIKRPYSRTTYGKAWYTPIIESSDKVFEYSDNSTRNRFNYSLKVPTGTGSAAVLQATLKRDLETYFGFHVSIETRSMPFWKIVVANKQKVESKLISKDQKHSYHAQDREEPYLLKNADMRDIVTALAFRYGQGSLHHPQLPFDDQGPFIDCTGIKEKLDFHYYPNWTLAEFQNYLESVGLSIIKSNRPMKVVVIRD